MRSFRIAAGIVSALLLWPLEAQPPTFKTGAQEVMLDLVVRDKRGRLVRDLRADEVEIYENGAKQDLKSLRLIEGGSYTESVSPAGEAGRKPLVSKPLDPMRQVRLIVLAFDRLGTEARRLSRGAVLELMKQNPGQNTYYSVVWLDPRIRIVQGFTNNLDLLRAALEKVTNSGMTTFSTEGDPLKNLIDNSNMNAAAKGGDGAPSDDNASPSSGQQGGAAAEAAMMAMVQRMATAQTEYSRAYQGNSSLTALWSVVEGLREMPGRKTILYFSEGLEVPQSTLGLFHGLLGAANRWNVSLYAVDSRGLTVATQLGSNADGIPIRGYQARHGLVNTQPIVDEDTRIESTRRSVQANLQELAESTGGLLISDTNNMGVPLKRVTEEIQTYYEAGYAPSDRQWDGKFRAVQVKVNRPGVTVQSRNGYFALPPEVQGVTLPHEVPLLRALATTPLPKQFEFKSAVLRFQPAPERTQFVVDVEIPMSNLSVQKDEKNRSYSTRVGFLIVVKDSQGRVVEKITRDVPFSGPLDKLDQFLAGNFIFTDNFSLTPGRYVVETAVLDRVGEKVSTKRSVLISNPAASGVALSSLAMVRRVDTGGQEPDPLRVEGGKIVPSLTAAVDKGTPLGLFFTVYPDSASAEKPDVLLEIISQGRPIVRAHPALPAPDGTGKIAVVANIETAQLGAGVYEVRVLARQSATAAEERMVVELRDAKDVVGSSVGSNGSASGKN